MVFDKFLVSTNYFTENIAFENVYLCIMYNNFLKMLTNIFKVLTSMYLEFFVFHHLIIKFRLNLKYP